MITAASHRRAVPIAAGVSSSCWSSASAASSRALHVSAAREPRHVAPILRYAALDRDIRRPDLARQAAAEPQPGIVHRVSHAPRGRARAGSAHYCPARRSRYSAKLCSVAPHDGQLARWRSPWTRSCPHTTHSASIQCVRTNPANGVSGISAGRVGLARGPIEGYLLGVCRRPVPAGSGGLYKTSRQALTAATALALNDRDPQPSVGSGCTVRHAADLVRHRADCLTPTGRKPNGLQGFFGRSPRFSRAAQLACRRSPRDLLVTAPRAAREHPMGAHQPGHRHRLGRRGGGEGYGQNASRYLLTASPPTGKPAGRTPARARPRHVANGPRP